MKVSDWLTQPSLQIHPEDCWHLSAAPTTIKDQEMVCDVHVQDDCQLVAYVLPVAAKSGYSCLVACVRLLQRVLQQLRRHAKQCPAH